MELDEIVALSVKHNASDLHLCCGHFPWWRCHGQLKAISHVAPVTGQQLSGFCERWLGRLQQQQLSRHGHCDLAITTADGTRLRASLFRQQCGLSLSLRILRTEVPDMQTLGLPAISYRLLERHAGLLLVTGATGCGKSTSLAAMIRQVNTCAARHIITLEDPVEYLHHSHHSLIQQREAGIHFSTFGEGLTAALRQDPDIIMLGELRDSRTLRLALTAAETGHLVLATLHTANAAQSVERLLESAPVGDQALVRTQLAQSLAAVISQRLISPGGPGTELRAVFEVLINTPAVANVIREGKTHQLPGLIETGIQSGMQSFSQALRQNPPQPSS